MNLSQFLHFNENCPVCGDSLTLYAQVSDGPLWKAKRPAPGIFHFEQSQCKSDDLAQDDFFWLEEKEDCVDVDFSTPKIFQRSKAWTLFFFYMCNEDSFEDSSKTNYGINPYKACYYRSSPFLEFKENEGKQWELKPVTLVGNDLIAGSVRDEIFIFKALQNSGDEKVYVLNSDYEQQSTTLRFYSVTPEERKNKFFDPNIFKKELPLLKVRPNFDLESRDRLISRFDSWILLS